MFVWFVAIAAAGVRSIVRYPEVLAGGEPAVGGAPSSRATPGTRFVVLGAWCCASPAARRSTPTWATSARGRFAVSWFAMVFPALLLNYFGQGAFLLEHTAGWRTRSTSIVPRGAALPDGGAGHRGHGDRLAGPHLRAPSRSPGRRCSWAILPRVTIVHTSAAERRADLRARGELRADGGLPGAGADLPEVEPR